MGLTTKDKKDWAKLLFVKTSMTQKDIAAQVGTTEKTMSDWISKNNWRKLKASVIITKQEELSRIYIQINELNSFIESKDEGHRYASSKEADTLSKLAAAAKTLESETSVSDTINVFIEFSDYLREVDLEQAQKFIEYQDGFIKHKLSKS